MKIYITCNAAMSTGILQMRLQEEAAKRGLDMTFQAMAYTELDHHYDEADMVLCSPQIRFMFNSIKEKMGNKPVMQISVSDFGLMNAPKIMDDILKAIK